MLAEAYFFNKKIYRLSSSTPLTTSTTKYYTNEKLQLFKKCFYII